jgi:hypothetical protein
MPHFQVYKASSTGEEAKEDIHRNSDLFRGGQEMRLLCVDV